MRLTGLFGQRVFYGWVIVAASFLLTFVGFTVVFSFSTYFEPLTREFRAEQSAVAFAFSLLSLLYFGLGAATGLLADRFGARKLAFATALI